MTNLRTEDLLVGVDQGEATATDMVIKARSARLGGDFSIMHGEVRPLELLAPHTHDNEDQAVYLLEGDAEIVIAGQPYLVERGELLLMPADKPHALTARTRFKMLLIMVRS